MSLAKIIAPNNESVDSIKKETENDILFKIQMHFI